MEYNIAVTPEFLIAWHGCMITRGFKKGFNVHILCVSYMVRPF